MFGISSILKRFLGDNNDKEIARYRGIVEQINALEPTMANLTDDKLTGYTRKFREQLAEGVTMEEILPEAFAVVRETSRRVLGMRHFDVQLIGGICLHEGRIAEMRTGEGKTLVATTAVYLNALEGKGVHVVTVNDYLARRDSEWMGKLYRYLGLSVGLIAHNMDFPERKAAYAADVTFGTNNEFGFDYLRDNMVLSEAQMVQRPLHYAIVDEVDSILIDEARTPLIISGPGTKSTDNYRVMAEAVRHLKEGEDYTVDEKQKTVAPADSAVPKIEKIVGITNLYAPENIELSHCFTAALRAKALMHRDRDYVVRNDEIVIVDEFTGRLMEGRRYSDGLHQAIEAKEGVKIQRESQTLASITFQNYFRMYDKLAGMTGTAKTEENEFLKIYNLPVIVIPTNKPVQRIDEPDVIYKTKAAKYRAVGRAVKEIHETGQPILIGTTSITQSEEMSNVLKKNGIPHVVLNAKFHEKEAEIVANAGQKGAVTIATNMAGRGTDIKLGEGVEALGGLYIVGTERHESRRIDNQLRGRSGRQGDPGRSKFFLSLDDDLMRLFGGESLKRVMTKVGMEPGEPIEHPWLNKSIEKAQTKVEERNFDIRKHLLEYDDVLNEQRGFIYEQRDKILQDEHLVERIYTTIEEYLDDAFEQFKHGSRKEKAEELKELQANLKAKFGYIFSDEDTKLAQAGDTSALQQKIYAALKANIEEKIALVGNENLNMFIRYQYLQAIDRKWLDHLENLEALREAVYLRSYGQKNPLTEYKLEGFDIFYAMLDEIRFSIASLLVLVRISTEEPSSRTPNRRIPQGSAHHSSMGSFHQSSSPMGSSSKPENVQVVRTAPKVGRNDPCPCGSGKKYKYCCGR